MNVYKPSRILITADRSSSGKTTLVMGLMLCLKKRNYDIQGFKVGLDYIDPSYHRYITNNDSRNLDGYVMEENDIKTSFLKLSKDKDISIIEGVRGVYEGIDIDTNIGSTYQISNLLEMPIILIMDVSSITKTAAAILKGIKDFKDLNIQGVVLNGVGSQKHEEKLKKAIRKYTDVEILGIISRSKEINIKMRHLGLIPAKEMDEEEKINKKLEEIRKVIEKNVDIERIVKIANEAKKLHYPKKRKRKKKTQNKKTKIAIAYDKSFNFYYSSNLNYLKRFGAELIDFSPIKDKKIPKEASGVYLGGGYPELFAEELSENEAMKKDIYKKANRGMPIYAECGGLMYLLKQLKTEENKFAFTGYFDGEVCMGKERVIGYVKGKMKKENPLGSKNDQFKGHEFHHSSIENLNEENFAYKLKRGKGIKNNKDGLLKNNTLASYSHLNFTSHEYIPKNFIQKCFSFEIEKKF